MEVKKEEQHIEISLQKEDISIKTIQILRKDWGDSINCILVLTDGIHLDRLVAEELVDWANAITLTKSFKVCGIDASTSEKWFGEALDWVPTQTEARDLIFMEEVERNLD